MYIVSTSYWIVSLLGIDTVCYSSLDILQHLMPGVLLTFINISAASFTIWSLVTEATVHFSSGLNIPHFQEQAEERNT